MAQRSAGAAAPAGPAASPTVAGLVAPGGVGGIDAPLSRRPLRTSGLVDGRRLRDDAPGVGGGGDGADDARDASLSRRRAKKALGRGSGLAPACCVRRSVAATMSSFRLIVARASVAARRSVPRISAWTAGGAAASAARLLPNFFLRGTGLPLRARISSRTASRFDLRLTPAPLLSLCCAAAAPGAAALGSAAAGGGGAAAALASGAAGGGATAALASDVARATSAGRAAGLGIASRTSSAFWASALASRAAGGAAGAALASGAAGGGGAAALASGVGGARAAGRGRAAAALASAGVGDAAGGGGAARALGAGAAPAGTGWR